MKVFDFLNSVGSWIIRAFVKKEEIRTRHLELIKKEILQPLLEKLKKETKKEAGALVRHSQDKEFNSSLLTDTFQNHFPEIGKNNKSYEKSSEEFHILVNKISDKLHKKYHKDFHTNSLTHYFVWSIKNAPWKLDAGHFSVNYGYYVICNAEKDEGLQIIKYLEQITKSKLGKEIRKKYSTLTNNRDELIESIEYALATEILKGNCSFLK